MTIDFECTEQDISDLNRFFIQTPAGKKEALRNFGFQSYVVFFCLMGVFGILNIISRHRIIPFELLISLTGAVIYFVSNIIYKNQNQDNQTKALIKRGNYDNALGNQTITISPDSLEQTTSKTKSTIDWSSISIVNETKDHIYLQTSPVMFYLIPKRAFANASHGAEFLRQLEQFRQQSTGEPIPQTTKGAWWTQGHSVIEEPQSNQVGRN